MSRFPSKKRIEAEFDGDTNKDEVVACLSWELAKRQRHGELQDTGWMDVVDSVRKYLEADEMSDAIEDGDLLVNEGQEVPLILHRADYRGDHSKDVRKPLVVDSETTVRELINGVIDKGKRDRTIEISEPLKLEENNVRNK